ncbi:MAG: molybdenum cofactor biosynthesis protein MoaE [Christensenellales bacterium]|nr:molybdenum cofactor biosynthesis protein MoaE [Christensenellales bacterium]
MHKKTPPSIDAWLQEAKEHKDAPKIGMYLTHNGVVRQSARAMAREGDSSAPPVSGMIFSYDRNRLARVVDEARRMEGIHYVRVWLNEGRLDVGDSIMFVLVGGDIRPRVVDALNWLVDRIKRECVQETELYDS